MEIFNRYKSYLERIDQSLLDSIPAQLPSTLKEPMLYFLSHPSKKLRPLLTIFSCEALGGRLAVALPVATAVELFHDFTLIHDDIMDEDDLRRGKPTIHVKWDSGTAIMVGDALIGLAYQQLMKSPSRFLSGIVEMFSEALVIVCEGQALDKAFETSRRVNMTEYLAMISKKTAWLFKTACGIGAILGGASPREIELLSQFGNNLGLAFQIQDDLLDFTAD
ncbi:MAG: polyprenyl synthetase family protein, partial [Calditrichia bacterium]